MVVAQKNSTRSLPRWKRRPDARPAEIADAALEVFAKVGFETATMDEIAMTAGVSKGTIYLYYPSKEDLLVASVENRIRSNQAKVLPILQSTSISSNGRLTRGDAKIIITKALEQILSLITGSDSLTTLRVVMAERHRSEKLREKITDMVNIGFMAMTGFLKHAHCQGAIDCPSPDIITRIILSLIISYALSDEIPGRGRGNPHSKKSREAIIEFALRGLGFNP